MGWVLFDIARFSCWAHISSWNSGNSFWTSRNVQYCCHLCSLSCRQTALTLHANIFCSYLVKSWKNGEEVNYYALSILWLSPYWLTSSLDNDTRIWKLFLKKQIALLLKEVDWPWLLVRAHPRRLWPSSHNFSGVVFPLVWGQVEELKETVKEEFMPWVSQYLVMKRVSIEPNFHSLYSNFLDTLKNPEFNKMVLNETYRNIKVSSASFIILR